MSKKTDLAMYYSSDPKVAERQGEEIIWLTRSRFTPEPYWMPCEKCGVDVRVSGEAMPGTFKVLCRCCREGLS